MSSGDGARAETIGEHKMNAKQKKTVALVDRAVSALATVDNLSSTPHFRALVALCAEEEKGHRGFMTSFLKYHPNAPGVKACARFFAVHRIGQYLAGGRMPEVKDFLHLQKSAFLAAAIVAEWPDHCRAALDRAGVKPEELATLDYSTFVSPEEVAA
jgi:hypothetical protein